MKRNAPRNPAPQPEQRPESRVSGLDAFGVRHAGPRVTWRFTDWAAI